MMINITLKCLNFYLRISNYKDYCVTLLDINKDCNHVIIIVIIKCIYQNNLDKIYNYNTIFNSFQLQHNIMQLKHFQYFHKVPTYMSLIPCVRQLLYILSWICWCTCAASGGARICFSGGALIPYRKEKIIDHNQKNI